jgi:acetyl-CoA decarbonylase/synthase, CODH/ACS complex subunit delta
VIPTTHHDKDKKKDDEGLLFSEELLAALAKFKQIELEDFQLDAKELEILFEPGMAATVLPKLRLPTGVAGGKPSNMMQASFLQPIEKYQNSIAKVKLGATKSEGGTRGRSLTVGGELSPAFYSFETPMPHKPVVTLDVFDMEVPLSKAVKMHVKDVVGDPAAWAKLAVEKFDADMVTMHLISVDPLLKDATPKDACKTIEKVLQAVDVPLVIGGCGDPVKDTALFEEVCAQFPGERFLMSSVTRDMDVEKCAKFIKKAGHAILAFTPMDLNFARELNRRLFDYVSREDIVMDLTTAALGYGLDYAFTNMERARIGGLMGDLELAQPMSSGTTNAWAAREAWLKMSAEWEPRELRGPLWEVTTALTLLTAGVDLFMMMHPAAVKTLKDVTNYMTANKKADPAKFLDWIKVKA